MEGEGNYQSIEYTPEVSESTTLSENTEEPVEITEDYEDCEVKETSESDEYSDRVGEDEEDYEDCELNSKEAEEVRDDELVEEHEEDEFQDCKLDNNEEEYEILEDDSEQEPEIDEVEDEISEEELEQEPEIDEVEDDISEEELEQEPEIDEVEDEISEEELEQEPEIDEVEDEISEEELEQEPEIDEVEDEISEEELEQEPEIDEVEDEISEEGFEQEPEIDEVEDEISEEELEQEPEIDEVEDEISEEELEQEPEIDEVEDEISEEELEQEPEIDEVEEGIAEEGLEQESEVEKNNDDSINEKFEEVQQIESGTDAKENIQMEVESVEVPNRDYKQSELDKGLIERDKARRQLEELEENVSLMDKEVDDKLTAVMEEKSGTEEYKQKLAEFNQAKDRRDAAKDELSNLKKVNDAAGQKVIEIRERQLQKGKEALLENDNIVDASNELQNRFQNSFYAKDVNKADLKAISRDDKTSIGLLENNKDSLKAARDAKMSEIRDYVFANNMNQFETEHDARYQRMMAEYIELDKAYSRLNYHIAKLNDNFEQIRERYPDISEGLSLKELDEIKKNVEPHYENGVNIANVIDGFDGYKEHNSLNGGHIEKVHDKSLEAADVFEEVFKNNNYHGLYSTEIDRKELEMMALYHDTGMDGNLAIGEAGQKKQDYLHDNERWNAFLEKNSEKNPQLTNSDIREIYEKEAFANKVRSDHSLQSAIHVLRDREVIEKHGVDADKVALGCFMHSKSNSGVRNLADEKQWEAAIQKIKVGVDEFNTAHPNEQIAFDKAFLYDAKGDFDSREIAKLRSESLCLRIGDANGHDSKSRISQSGKTISFSLEQWNESKEDFDKIVLNNIEKAQYEKFIDEVANAKVRIGEKVLDSTNDKDGFGRMFALGEGNFGEMKLELKDDVPVQKIVLVNGNAYPLSTQNCIYERMQEFKTARVAEVDNAKTVRCDFEIKLGDVEKTTRKSYESFAKRMRKEGFRVRLL